MPLDPDALLAMLRDPNAESQQIADAVGAAREEVGRAARLVHSVARAKAEEVVSLPPPLAIAVLRAAFAAGRSDVLAAAAASASREVAKEGKRGLHVLKTRGVAVPELPRVAQPSAPAVAEPDLPCYASSVDGQGERAVWMARTVPGKGVEVAQAILSDVKGLLSLQVGMLGRKEYRAFAGDLLGRGASLGIAEVSRERAHGLLGEGRRIAEATGKALPEGAGLWLGRLGEAPPLPDPAARFAPLPDEEERAAVAASGRLHELPLVRGWLAEEEALRPLAARLEEIASSPLHLDDAQRRAQAEQAVDAAVRDYFDGPRRSLWSRRLFHTGAHLADSGDEPGARLAAAAARALAAGADPSAVPFARMLFAKALSAPAAGPARSPAGTDAPLLVTPP